MQSAVLSGMMVRMMFLVPVLLILFGNPAHALAQAPSTHTASAPSASIPQVPFYSQFADITSSSWQKRGCGIASLAMVIGFYQQSPVSVNKLLTEGIAAKAYSSAGWTYSGLIKVAQKHGMQGSAYDLSLSSSHAAFTSFTHALEGGPVIASVHYKFDPKSTIPHLVVIDAIKNGTVYYNDPAARSGEKTISTETFVKAWKQRFIVIRPQSSATKLALSTTP